VRGAEGRPDAGSRFYVAGEEEEEEEEGVNRKEYT